ncbi:MAG: O-antigen ligase family protein [Actinobacteria bacterium]|nr:O-antigen ligase family protein [Actinomycetota bacterium]
MSTQVESSAIGRVIGWTAILATLAITPWATFDPINVPKLAVIALGGFVTLSALLMNAKRLFARKHRTVQFLIGLFVLDLIIVLFFAGTNPYQEFFGTYGRSTGFVAYIALASLMLGAVVVASTKFVSTFTRFLLIAGGLSIGYGLLQAIGADPIKWVNQYSSVIGFLGNPNFQSSFVGFSGVLAFAFICAQGVKRSFQLSYGIYLLLAIFVIIKTHSQQGLLVLAGGIAIVVMIWISRSQFKRATIPALIVSAIGAIFIALGSLNSGPLASLLYKASVTYRGDYWRAGWKMTVEHPFLGVGLDSFGDWYRRTRTLEATLRRGPEVTSNAAHNVLLDFSSNGGFPLVLIYLALMVLVVISAIKLLKRSSGFDPAVSGLIAVWIAYQAQSIISLNQLGLAVWGWIISGLIIGYEINTRPEEVRQEVKSPVSKGRNVKKQSSESVSAKTLVSMVIGGVVGLLVGLPPFIASAQFKSAFTSGDAGKVEKSAYLWPDDPTRYGQVGLVLQANKLDAQAQKIVDAALLKFPNEFGLWSLASKLTTATPEQVAKAKEEMKRLDPFNPDVK